MSKTKNKEHKPDEHLKGLIKKLRSENKQLRQRLKQIENKSHFYEHIADEVVEDITVGDACTFCGKGNLQTIDLKFLSLIKCDICDFSERVKK